MWSLSLPRVATLCLFPHVFPYLMSLLLTQCHWHPTQGWEGAGPVAFELDPLPSFLQSSTDSGCDLGGEAASIAYAAPGLFSIQTP